jgi:hypothetical protein
MNRSDSAIRTLKLGEHKNKEEKNEVHDKVPNI